MIKVTYDNPIPYTEFLVMECWLCSNAGQEGFEWNYSIYYRHWEIKDPMVATMFKLRFAL